MRLWQRRTTAQKRFATLQVLRVREVRRQARNAEEMEIRRVW